MDNIFEHGGDRQYKIIKPFLEKANKYSPGKHGEFEQFFFRLLEVVLNVRAETEQEEDWVFDSEEYRKKSEVVITIALLDSITCLQEISDGYVRGPQFFLGDFFQKLVAFGEKKGWDLPSLQMQFTKTVGLLPMVNPLMDIISRQVYTSIDYN